MCIRDSYQIMQENRRRVDEERQELQTLVSDISHQVKTPVSNLKMATDTLLEKPMTEAERTDFMARMSNKRRLEWSFFLNDRSRITYNELCRKCQHECKQSFRAVVVDCPKYLSKRSKKKDKTAGNGKIP